MAANSNYGDFCDDVDGVGDDDACSQRSMDFDATAETQESREAPDVLARLDDPILIRLTRFCDVPSLLVLGRVSRRLRTLLQSKRIWRRQARVLGCHGRRDGQSGDAWKRAAVAALAASRRWSAMPRVATRTELRLPSVPRNAAIEIDLVHVLAPELEYVPAPELEHVSAPAQPSSKMLVVLSVRAIKSDAELVRCTRHWYAAVYEPSRSFVSPADEHGFYGPASTLVNRRALSPRDVARAARDAGDPRLPLVATSVFLLHEDSGFATVRGLVFDGACAVTRCWPHQLFDWTRENSPRLDLGPCCRAELDTAGWSDIVSMRCGRRHVALVMTQPAAQRSIVDCRDSVVLLLDRETGRVLYRSEPFRNVHDLACLFGADGRCERLAWHSISGGSWLRGLHAYGGLHVYDVTSRVRTDLAGRDARDQSFATACLPSSSVPSQPSQVLVEYVRSVSSGTWPHPQQQRTPQRTDELLVSDARTLALLHTARYSDAAPSTNNRDYDSYCMVDGTFVRWDAESGVLRLQRPLVLVPRSALRSSSEHGDAACAVAAFELAPKLLGGPDHLQAAGNDSPYPRWLCDGHRCFAVKTDRSRYTVVRF